MSVRRTLIGATAVALAAAAGGAPAAQAAKAPRVQAMVVDRSGDVFGPRTVRASRTTVRSSGRRCRVAPGLGLSVLAALRRAGGPSFRARGGCGGSLYVFQVGSDREAGRGGWVYKVGRKIGTVGAADPSGPFGTGRRLRSGQRVTWFWCVTAGRCQRTLSLRLSADAVAPGTSYSVRVIAHDDLGRGRAQGGVTVSAGGDSATTDASGLATLTAPSVTGRYRVRATTGGLVPAFPEVLRVR